MQSILVSCKSFFLICKIHFNFPKWSIFQKPLKWHVAFRGFSLASYWWTCENSLLNSHGPFRICSLWLQPIVSCPAHCGWWAGALLPVLRLVFSITKKASRLFREICWMSEPHISWSWVSAWFTGLNDNCRRETQSATGGPLTKDPSTALSHLKEFLCTSLVLICPCCLEMCNFRTHNAPNIVFGSQVKIEKN